MFFWIICILLTLCVATYLARPLLRDRTEAATPPDVAFYKSQLDEISRDQARAVLEPNEAELARAEIARRLIAADARAQTTTAPTQADGRVMAVLAGVFLLTLSLGTYWKIGSPGEPDLPLAQRHAQSAEMRANRPDQAALEAAAPPVPAVDAPQAYLDSVTQLREIVPTRPDDLRGWELLAFHETEMRDYAAAARAQARVIALKGEDATAEDQRLYLDMLVTAADGYVSPKAEAVARALIADDPDSIPGRYYLGALLDQTDRPDLAFRLWQPLIDSGVDTYHTALARAQIENAAQRAGVRYTLPEISGPSADDIANAADLSPEDRAAMINGMVARLSNRLATEGGSAADWARLIAAYGVLGDTESASAIWTEASGVFGADPTSMDTLRSAAKQAGVVE